MAAILDLSDLGDLREKDVLPQFSFVRAHEGEGLDEVCIPVGLNYLSEHIHTSHPIHLLCCICA